MSTTPRRPSRTSAAAAGDSNSGVIGVRFVSDEVKRDHRDLEIVYKALAVAIGEGDDGAAARLQRQFCWELARHLVAMQLLIFPGTNRRAEMGNAVAVRRRADLSTIRDHLLHFVYLEPSDPKFQPALDPLIKTLRQHIRDVERSDLVAIEKALDAEESERMARDWERAGRFMPVEEEGREKPPFATIEELLGASYDELNRAWERLPRD